MSTRLQRSCLIISALVMSLAPGLDAQARPELPTPETGPGFKSGTTALMWSLLGTLVPIGVGVVASSTAGEASDNPLPGFLILGGMLVGPALGHFYAGRSGHALAGIGIRTLTLAAFLGGAAASWNGDSGGDALLLAGLVAGLALLVAGFVAVSLYASCLTVHPVAAALAAFAALLGMVLIGDAAGDGLRTRGWTVAAGFAQVLSPIKNFEPFGKGMLDTHALVCSVLLVAVFLTLAVRQLDAQRLRG